MIVRVPSSSANLGPGFDALGMALDWAVFAGSVDESPPEGARWVEETHPAAVAHRRAGGDGRIWLQCSLPVGRGLGFSGAVRVAGAALALVGRTGAAPDTAETAAELLDLTAALDGHPDNVAASIYGGVVAVAAGRAVRLPLALDAAVVVWVPEVTTSTDRSRRQLPSSVDFADAAFNVGRTALLVAALCTGDTAALRSATEDRLHQDVRLADRPESRDALERGLDAGAWCGWLSGSGPTVAFLCEQDDADALVHRLPGSGRSHVVGIDHDGARLVTAAG